MTELLLITGSRDINETGIAYARKAVARAAALGYEVIVGDASGVDEAVMQECHRLGMTCTVVGAYGRLRRRTPSCKVVQREGSYPQRDRYMAEQCTECLAIWNGESRGTKITYNHAVALGKTTWLRTFHSEDSRGERPANSGGNAMTHVDMWTDGACSGNPGPGGWAAVLRCGQHQKEVVDGTPETTNNRAEMMAVIAGLEALKFPCSVTIYTDSQYVIGVASKGWKRKANHDLLARADALMAKHTVSFEHVKGHSGDAINERCDRLARAEVERQRSMKSLADFPANGLSYTDDVLKCQNANDCTVCEERTCPVHLSLAKAEVERPAPLEVATMDFNFKAEATERCGICGKPSDDLYQGVCSAECARKDQSRREWDEIERREAPYDWDFRTNDELLSDEADERARCRREES